MLAETGHFLLILAIVVALGSGCLMLAAHWQPGRAPYLERQSRALALLGACSWLGAMAVLALCFITDDFSVAYVANHSNTALPLLFKVAALWGSHEGSLLFWAALLALFAVLFFNTEPTLGLSQWLLVGFGLVILLSANPFMRLLPGVPPEGRDLNPVLQDIGLILHPPMLFIGYVFLCLMFVQVMANLWQGNTDKAHQAGERRLRTLTLFGWLFLTGGNVLGSWWAYNELGWGGWWFWDPVENAAFIPWLLTTALLHCFVAPTVNGKPQPLLQSAATLLTITAFGCCLLGSFLVRSGIVQSVHAFASSPERGISLLLLLAGCLVPALYLFAVRHLKGDGQGAPTPAPPLLLLLGMAVIASAALTVLLGTLYPLLHELLGLGKISVGAPYFNSVFVPLVWLAALAMGWRWFASHQQRLQAAIGALLLPLGWLYFNQPDSMLYALMGLSAACWLLFAEVTQWFSSNSRRRWARLAHLGAAISILGATFVSQYETEAVLRMGPDTGKTISSLGSDYSFVYRETARVETRAFHAIEGRIELLGDDGMRLHWLYPQRQSFKSNGMEMSQAGIVHGVWQDFYVSMGQKLDDNTYLIRLSVKPLVSWLWLGGGLMMLAAIASLLQPLLRARLSPTGQRPQKLDDNAKPANPATAAEVL
ncbi:cytochrome c biogenesis protein CcsA [Shewanella sp. JM162201]|uniref:Cytochrome c biogenesis protein CcsA n=1 Tax=Shewanella jiangmenensis TaxID=2837387 RepID=A0ABS5V2L4_9GAMM|nr:cytochrome c-type biogenesis CcmF C-terminal domain-containing protein [Shewanella jiangmenensis]MBT1444062.1 cytochrome c biogenesis protein CcsA [Shewanella jiangmenensis]